MSQLENLSTCQQWVTLLEQQQRWQELEAVCRQAIPFHPNVARFHHLLGDALLQLQCYQEAVKAYQNAIALDPNFSWSHNNLADALLQLQRYQEAVKAYQNAIALKNDFPWSYYNLGDALLQLEQWEAAHEAYQSALEIDPYLPEAQTKLADAIQGWISLSDEPLQAYRQAIMKNPNNLELIKKAINLFPNHIEFYLGLSQAFVNSNDPDKALVVCRMGLTIQPNHEKALKLEHQLLYSASSS